ncbi:MAG TPA: hypothetical protein VJ787_01085 [Thermoleophilia bacterium]|nr:hypothetical protein [Thermoleophilia bacterium]
MRDAFIGLHVAGGIVAFLTGPQLIRAAGEAQGRLRLYPVFAAALATMIVFVAAAIAVDWPSLATAERWVFCGLLVLALYMAYRALLGWRRLRQHPDGQDRAFVEPAKTPGRTSVASLSASSSAASQDRPAASLSAQKWPGGIGQPDR